MDLEIILSDIEDEASYLECAARTAIFLI